MCCSGQAGQETDGVFVQGWGPPRATGHRPQLPFKTLHTFLERLDGVFPEIIAGNVKVTSSPLPQQLTSSAPPRWCEAA